MACSARYTRPIPPIAMSVLTWNRPPTVRPMSGSASPKRGSSVPQMAQNLAPGRSGWLLLHAGHSIALEEAAGAAPARERTEDEATSKVSGSWFALRTLVGVSLLPAALACRGAG